MSAVQATVILAEPQLHVVSIIQVGFGAAVQYCLDQDIHRCWQRTQHLAAQLRHQLVSEVPGLVLHDRGRVLCGLVSFTISCAPDAEDVKNWLAGRTPPINVRHLTGEALTIERVMSTPAFQSLVSGMM